MAVKPRNRLCTVPLCESTVGSHGAKDMCRSHYGKWLRHGDPNWIRPQTDRVRSKRIANDYRVLYEAVWLRSSEGRYSAFKRAARNKGGTNLAKEEYLKLIESNSCHYCQANLNETGHALDRKDSNKGYVAGNLVPCCYRCNKIKGDSLSYEEMLAISEYLKIVRSRA